MSKITLEQGAVTATLSGLCYLPETSGLDNDTDYVIAEVITADADVILKDGSGLIGDGKDDFEVEVAVVTVRDADEDEGPVCELEISYCGEGGLIKLALDLGLLENCSAEQLRALLDGPQSPEET